MSASEAVERRRFRASFAALVAASAVVRIAYVLIVKRDDPLWTDEVFYSRGASAIAHGRWFENPFEPGVPSAGHAPMTVVMLAPVSWLDGVVTAQRLLMALYGTMVVAGIGALTRWLVDRRTALVATAFGAVYAGLWLNDVMVMSETFAAATVLGILWSAYHYRGHVSWRSAVLFGVAVGLAGYARTELLGLGGVIGIALMWSVRDDASRPIGRGHLVAAGLVSVALLAPWVIRNQIEFEEPVYISTQDGGTLLGANCEPAYDGRFVGFWLIECVSAVPMREGEDQSQTEARYRAEAVDYIGEHVSELPRVVVFRVARGFGLYRPNEMTIVNQLDGRNRWASWLSTVQFWVFGLLATAGLRWWPSSGVRRIPRWPVVATMVFTVVMMAITYGNPRFRIPIEPGLVLAAAVGAVAMFDRSRVSAGRRR